jgi:ribonuclease HII
MIRAVDSLPVKPSKIFIDGKYIPEGLSNAESVIKGDQLIQEISAASIFAKYYRDSLMAAYHLQLSNYNFKKNKGYPTLEHKDAISAYGLSKIHRKSFKI